MSRSKRIESGFQDDLRKTLFSIFPGCFIFKVSCKQGMPDLLVLWKNKWALLECKKSKNAAHQPNQDYYVNLFNEMSFSSFIYPENKNDVLDKMKGVFFNAIQ